MEGAAEILVAGLLLAVVVLVTAARVLKVPYPIFLVLGGLAAGLVPGAPDVRLEPELVLLIFLPPLLYGAAFFTPLRELRANVGPIGLLAVGLVVVTCLAVAAVAHAVIPGIDWPTAFVLGAIVSPTDPVAATAIAGRLGLPQRVVTVVEGESLINDATALVAYKVAVGAVVTGSFSLLDASGRFLLGAIGGVAIGLLVGFVVAAVRRRLDDPPVEITISILTAYLAYLPAEELGLSGVVAAVTVGLYMGSRTSRVTSATTRMQTTPVWEILIFLLNSSLFVLVGMQVGSVLDDLRGAGTSAGELVAYSGAVSATVMVVRIAWTFVFTRLPGLGMPRREVAIVSWMGMRGAVSLAAALALPAAVEAGGAFPRRDVLVFVAFAVILVTLLVQGLSVPWLVRALRVRRDDSRDIHEETVARLHAARAALARLDALAAEERFREESVTRLRGLLSHRHRRFAARLDEDDDGHYETITDGWTELSLELIAAQREAVERLRREHVISDEIMRRVERDLDLEEARLLGG